MVACFAAALCLALLPGPGRAAHLPPTQVVVFPLTDSQPAALAGAEANARLVPRLLPGWGVRFYADAEAVPAAALQALAGGGAAVVAWRRGRTSVPPMLWPLLVEDDAGVERYLVRRPATRLARREAGLVQEWVRTGAAFHCIRDHPGHDERVEAGLWGARRGVISALANASMHELATSTNWSSAASLLQEKIWPLVESQAMCHDAFDCHRAHRRPVTVERRPARYIGQFFDGASQPIHRKWSRKRTEQCVQVAWLHVIVNFFRPSSPARRQEIFDTLRSHLRNPVVAGVHLVGQNLSGVDGAVEGLPLAARRKVTLVPLQRGMLYADAFGYASRGALNHSVCIVLNGDIMLGYGFDALGPAHLELLRPYVFALSRHPSPHCMDDHDECALYHGSHDAFLFVPPLPPEAVARLAFRQNMYQAENVVLAELQRVRHLHNPCFALHVHHFHCSAERRWRRQRRAAGPDLNRRRQLRVPPQRGFPWKQHH